MRDCVDCGRSLADAAVDVRTGVCFRCAKLHHAERRGVSGPYHCPQCHDVRYEFLYYEVRLDGHTFRMCTTCLHEDW